MTIGRLRGSVDVVVGGRSIVATLGDIGAGTDVTISSITGGAGMAASATGCLIGGLSGCSDAARFELAAIRPRACSAIANPTAARANNVQLAAILRRRAAPQRSSVVMPKGRYWVATVCANSLSTLKSTPLAFSLSDRLVRN